MRFVSAHALSTDRAGARHPPAFRAGPRSSGSETSALPVLTGIEGDRLGENGVNMNVSISLFMRNPLSSSGVMTFESLHQTLSVEIEDGSNKSHSHDKLSQENVPACL
ncbi:unnamed protein product [Protopolystoma xenopodis]|uniref:Uncharacterized protein n=1 Tax=Protopolystoma xenopodis TaxID=117903 RepID=A0A3S5CMX5_9PLAT|nr:unnamed protein product [Protopolystoma xenopodis]